MQSDDKLHVNNEETGDPTVDRSEMKQETETENAPQPTPVKHECMASVNSADVASRENEDREERSTADCRTPASSAMTQTENPESSERHGEAGTVDGGGDGNSSRIVGEDSEQSRARRMTRSRSPRKQAQGDTEPNTTVGPKASRFVLRILKIRYIPTRGISCIVHDIFYIGVFRLKRLIVYLIMFYQLLIRHAHVD